VLNILNSGTGSAIDITADAVTTGDVITVSADGLTIGSALHLSSTSLDGDGGRILSIGNAATPITFNPSAGGSQYGQYINISNAPTVAANIARGIYINLSDTTTFANTDYGVYSTVTHTGPISGTINTYAGYFSATGDGGGISTAYGVYGTATGADTNYGVYGNAPSSIGVFGEGGTAGVIGEGTFAPGVHGFIVGSGSCTGGSYGCSGVTGEANINSPSGGGRLAGVHATNTTAVGAALVVSNDTGPADLVRIFDGG